MASKIYDSETFLQAVEILNETGEEVTAETIQSECERIELFNASARRYIKDELAYLESIGATFTKGDKARIGQWLIDGNHIAFFDYVTNWVNMDKEVRNRLMSTVDCGCYHSSAYYCWL